MKKFLTILVILIAAFILANLLDMPFKVKASYLFDKHTLAGGLYGSEGIPFNTELL